jgi:hypothetical protein
MRNRMGNVLKVPADSVQKVHTWPPDGALATGVRNCGRERAGGCSGYSAWTAQAGSPRAATPCSNYRFSKWL